MLHFQILCAVVCLCGGSQINHYNYILTVRMSKQFKLGKRRSQVSVISFQQGKMTDFTLSKLRNPQ
jgi:hypothetical protein